MFQGWGNVLGEMFITAEPNSVYGRIYANNMDPNESFVDVNTGLDYVAHRHHNAYLEDKQFVLAHRKHACEVL